MARRRAARLSADAASDVRIALDALRRIVQALRVAGHHGGRVAGLTSAQLFTLQQIAAHPGVSINEVASLTFTHQSSVSVVIRRLVAQGLVAKVAPAHDRRRQHLALTAAGRRLMRRAPTAVQERLIAAIGALPPAERRRFARLLDGVVRRVAPALAGRRPPMLFEESTRTARG